MSYWNVTVQIKIENDNGKVQKTRELYLVDAESSVEATSKIYKDFEGESNFEVVATSKSKVIKIV